MSLPRLYWLYMFKINVNIQNTKWYSIVFLVTLFSAFLIFVTIGDTSSSANSGREQKTFKKAIANKQVKGILGESQGVVKLPSGLTAKRTGQFVTILSKTSSQKHTVTVPDKKDLKVAAQLCPNGKAKRTTYLYGKWVWKEKRTSSIFIAIVQTTLICE